MRASCAYHVVQKRTIWYMSAKDDLLAAAMAYVTEHGIGELSLR
jgi:hypothetical protein